MADKTIDQLTSAGALSGTEELPIWQTGATVKTTVSAVAGKAVMTLPINKDDGTFTYQYNGVSGDILIQSASKANSLFNMIILGSVDGTTTSTVQIGAQTPNWTTQIIPTANQADPGFFQFLNNGQTNWLHMNAGIPAFGGQQGDVSWDTQTPTFWIRETTGTWVVLPDGPPSTFIDLGSLSGTIALSAQRYKTTKVTLVGNATFTLTTPPASMAHMRRLYIVQGGSGSNTVTWPGSVKWPSGTAPTLTTTVGKTDCFDLETIDGGTTWYATTRGLNF